MDRKAQLSSPSGEPSILRPLTPDRIRTQRPLQSPQLRWPEWGPAAQVSPWDGLAHPCAPLRASVEAAGSGSALTRRTHVRSVLRWGREMVAKVEGGVHPMLKRLAVALSTLAALFLVAGAGSKW